MPGLNPLMNAQPQHQIPNEAPSYFSPFFEQTPRPAPVAIWQPPTLESSRRSKVPVNIARPPINIPTAGTWQQPAPVKPENEKKQLFQPKKRKSLEDDIMWLGQVSGFTGKAPEPKMQEHPFVRSKLQRRPEEKPSQASALTGPRALEEKKRREEEEKAREQRLAEWATKKKKSSEKDKRKHPSGDEQPKTPAEEWLPQPVESSMRSSRSSKRGKIFIPQPQPVETIRSKHRPNLPYNEVSFAPSNPILPQPIETLRRSNRPSAAAKSEPEEQVWIGGPSVAGLPQPVESVRRSNRKSPLSKVAAPDEQPSLRRGTTHASDHVDHDHLEVPHPNETTGRLDEAAPKPNEPEKNAAPVQPLPQPIESTRRAADASAKKEILPEPVESTRRSNRPNDKPLLPEPVETTRRTNRPQPEQPKSIAPQPIETTRRTNRPVYRVERRKEILPEPIASTWKSTRGVNKVFLPEPIETTRRSSRPAQAAIATLPQPIEISKRSNRLDQGHARSGSKGSLPQPVESSRRSNRPTAAPVQDAKNGSPPTPTTSFFGPDMISKPMNFTRHPAQPLIPQHIETSWTTRIKHGPEMHIELPQPITVSRWKHDGQVRRESADRKSFDDRPRSRREEREQAKYKVWTMPEDHVSHLHEPVDSLPPSPEHSPEGPSPESSKCPSLSSSPTSSASSVWGAGPGKGDSNRTPKDLGVTGLPAPSQPTVVKSLDDEYPFPELPKDKQQDNLALFTREATTRSDSLETIRPSLRAFVSDPTDVTTGKIQIQPRKSTEDNYPICHSPVFEKFNVLEPPRRPSLSEVDEQKTTTLSVSNNNVGIAIHVESPMSPPVTSTSAPISRSHSMHDNSSSALASGPSGGLANSMYRGMGSMPGYTVASLPPKAKRRHEDAKKEVTDQFVDEVWGYLSFGFDNIACKFDPELAENTGLSIDDVRSDRRRAVRLYCEHWVQDHPSLEGGEHMKGGYW